MSKFNLGELLKDAGVSESDTAQERIEYIPLDRIDPDPENFYSLDGLDELAANIETVGLQQPLRVRTLSVTAAGGGDSSPRGGAKDARYVVVSGHRRRAALMLIRDGGSDMFRDGVPCIVERGDVSREMQELRLIYANSSTRVLTSAELSRQAERVEELLYKLQEQGVSFPGRMRDHVAAAVNASKSKLARLHAIRNNLDSGLLAYYDNGDLTEDAAYALSRFPPNLQEAIARELTGGKQKKMPVAIVVKEVLDRLDSLMKPIPCRAHAGGPECHHGEGRVLCSVFKQYSWDMCPEGQCCMDCYKGKQGCSGACREAKDRFKLEKDVEAEKAAERKAADDVKFDRRRADIERRCRELQPLVDAAGLKDEDKLFDNYEAATAGQVRAWETEMWRRVKKRREELGLSIADVYETDDDYANVIEGYENGEPCEWDPITELSLTDDERNDFADLLQCSLDYLYSRSDIPETAEQLLNNLPTAELCEAVAWWNEGTPPKDGRYFARIDMGDGGVHEAVGSYYGGSWSVFGGPLYEKMTVVGWWPLPEREAAE